MVQLHERWDVTRCCVLGVVDGAERTNLLKLGQNRCRYREDEKDAKMQVFVR